MGDDVSSWRRQVNGLPQGSDIQQCQDRDKPTSLHKINCVNSLGSFQEH